VETTVVKADSIWDLITQMSGVYNFVFEYVCVGGSCVTKKEKLFKPKFRKSKKYSTFKNFPKNSKEINKQKIGKKGIKL
jgi:hypothetical protein